MRVPVTALWRRFATPISETAESLSTFFRSHDSW
jgi:hypothetical protein